MENFFPLGVMLGVMCIMIGVLFTTGTPQLLVLASAVVIMGATMVNELRKGKDRA